jgi:hypothetical protein
VNALYAAPSYCIVGTTTKHRRGKKTWIVFYRSERVSPSQKLLGLYIVLRSGQSLLGQWCATVFTYTQEVYSWGQFMTIKTSSLKMRKNMQCRSLRIRSVGGAEDPGFDTSYICGSSSRKGH